MDSFRNRQPKLVWLRQKSFDAKVVAFISVNIYQPSLMKQYNRLKFIAYFTCGIVFLLLASSAECATNMTPLAVTGFNRDVVVENTAPTVPYTNAAKEFNTGEGTAFYQAGLSALTNGLPAGRQFTNATDGAVFQFQSYIASNILVLYTNSSAGSLTLTAPTTYSRIAVVAHSGNGTATGTGTLLLTFSDGSIFATNYSAPDWFNNSGNIALQGVDRVNLNTGTANGGSAGNPRFYQTTIPLFTLGVSNKALASLTFGMPASTKSTAIYAVSGLRSADVSLPAVTNLAATSVLTTAAVLNGQITSVGGETPVVTLFYGPTNGGVVGANWSNSIALGYQSGSYSQAIASLTPNTTYYFTARATNSGGVVWASAVQSFTTPAATPSTITNLPASNIQASFATLNGQVLNIGGDVPTVTLYYGPANGGSIAANWANSLSLGAQSGAFSQTVTGLGTNTLYYFTAKAMNSGGTTWSTPSLSFTTVASNAPVGSVAVLTQHNNNSHDGANLNETILSVANVNTNTFGLLYSRPVDDQIYAQPLLMTNVTIPGKGVHNVIYVATVNDSVYAFDADDASVTAPYWKVNFTNANAVAPRNTDMSALGSCGGNYNDFSGAMGIVGTPVIDPVAGTIFLVARTKENGSTFVQRLHALDITTGAERPNSPVVITATYPGNGDGSVGGIVSFDPARNNQRPGLTLLNGVVYIGWSSHCDLGPYHGWIIGYNTTNLSQAVVYNDTPNGSDGGIWMSGEGISADTNGFLYLAIGNGTVGYAGNPRDTLNRGESFLKLSRGTTNLNVVSWFTPYNYQALENGDIDLGSAGFLLIPGTTLAFSGGKQGVGYLVDRNNMGGLTTSTTTNDNILQSWSLTGDQLHGGMVWWDGPGGNSYGYIWPASVFLQQYKFNRTTNRFVLPAFAQSPSSAPGGQPGGILALTANGTNAGSGILWASHQLTGNANQSVRPGIFHAYNAQNVTNELWNSEMISSRDSVGTFAKFVPPTVANGKVYLATFSGRLNVYGNAAGWVAQPIIAPSGGTFTGSTNITITETTPGATVYFTLDGSSPTTNSILYTGPFTITNSTVISARGYRSGFVDSVAAVATVLNSSVIGNGTGLKGSYYSNQAKTFTDPATLVRTDSTVNFDWGNGSPDPSISVDTFTARWTGSVQPVLSDTYTFYTTTDDGVRLWINNQLVIDSWVDQSPTERSGSISLVSQQRYNFRMEYFENGGGAAASLSWGTPLMAKVIIPQSQLYITSNPPPSITLTSPVGGSSYTTSASVTMKASASALYNTISKVDFYTNANLVGSVTNSSGTGSNSFTLTATGLGAGNYSLIAVATDLSGLSGTSAPVNITVNTGSGAPYGLTTRATTPAFFNMPMGFSGPLPAQISQTGIFSNTPAMTVKAALIPYNVNAPLWSDNATKTRYFAVPNSGAPYTPDEQITFTTNGQWTFPVGSVFVKTFELVTNEATPAQKRRLETRLFVCDTNGGAYGVTYKWRTDNSDADLILVGQNENINVTTAGGVQSQVWYYPSPSDCLQCHTPAANYVLGLNTRQFNGNCTYPATAQTDNQLRTLNRVGLFNPAFNETNIATYTHLSSLTNLSISLDERARSYLDANCSHCHRPGGAGITMDARYDTPFTNQNILNALLSKGDLGADNARVVVAKDIWRSVLYGRMNSTDTSVKMPPLARNLIDTNAVKVMGDWINSLPGIPALAPPTITPNGGNFAGSVLVTLQHPDSLTTLRYTVDGSLPTNTSALFSGSIVLTNNLTIRAKAFENGFSTSVAANAIFIINPEQFTFVSLTNGVVHLFFAGTSGQTYVLQASTNLVNWESVATNVAPAGVFEMVDPSAANFRYRFYRTMQ